MTQIREWAKVEESWTEWNQWERWDQEPTTAAKSLGNRKEKNGLQNVNIYGRENDTI
jgi:hypothetical protein